MRNDRDPDPFTVRGIAREIVESSLSLWFSGRYDLGRGWERYVYGGTSREDGRYDPFRCSAHTVNGEPLSASQRRDSPCRHQSVHTQPCRTCERQYRKLYRGQTVYPVWHWPHTHPEWDNDVPEDVPTLVIDAGKWLDRMFAGLARVPWIYDSQRWRAWRLWEIYGSEAASLVRQEMHEYYREDEARVRKLANTLRAANNPPEGLLLACAAFNAVAGAKRLDAYLGPSGQMFVSLDELTPNNHNDHDEDCAESSIIDKLSYRQWRYESEPGERPSESMAGFLIREMEARKGATTRLSAEHFAGDMRKKVTLSCPFCGDDNPSKQSAQVRRGLFLCFGDDCPSREVDPDQTGMDYGQMRQWIKGS